MMKKSKKGNVAVVGVVIGVIVALIAIVAVGVPITKSIVSSANLSGIDATIATYLPTFLMLGALILVATLLYFKARG